MILYCSRLQCTSRRCEERRPAADVLGGYCTVVLRRVLNYTWLTLSIASMDRTSVHCGYTESDSSCPEGQEAHCQLIGMFDALGEQSGSITAACVWGGTMSVTNTGTRSIIYFARNQVGLSCEPVHLERVGSRKSENCSSFWSWRLKT